MVLLNTYILRAVIKSLLWLSVLDLPLILWVKLSAVERGQSHGNKFATGVGGTGDSKLNDSPAY